MGVQACLLVILAAFITVICLPLFVEFANSSLATSLSHFQSSIQGTRSPAREF